jgi:hypothetical protein
MIVNRISLFFIVFIFFININYSWAQAGSSITAGDLVARGFIPGKKMQQPGVSAGGTIDTGRVFVIWICVGSVDASNPERVHTG